ncbi:hypothetical protein [Serratia sp. D1N4]
MIVGAAAPWFRLRQDGHFPGCKKTPDIEWVGCYIIGNIASNGFTYMHINTKHKLFILIYLTAAYAVAIPLIYMIMGLVFGGALADMWKGEYSFYDFLEQRKIIYLKLSAVGGLMGLAYWFAFYRKYRYFDPLDKYFK